MSKKVTINIELELKTSEDIHNFELLSKLIADPYKVTSVLNRFHSELIRPAFKHGYNDPKLEELSQKEGAYELINLLWEKYYDIIKEEGLEEFLE